MIGDRAVPEFLIDCFARDCISLLLRTWLNRFQMEKEAYMRRLQARFLIAGVAAIFFILSLSIAEAQEAQKSSRDTHRREEAGLYKDWYEAQSKKDYGLAKLYASRYLMLYPNGQYASYLSKWIEKYKYIAVKEGVAGDPRESVPENPRLQELFYAVESGKLEVVEKLLQALIADGDDVNIRIKDGRTLLMLAALHGEVDVVQAILGKGADIDIKDTNGWTAVVYAIWSDNIDVVQTLLNAGADVNYKDVDGASLLDIAIIRGNSDITQVIRRALGRY